MRAFARLTVLNGFVGTAAGSNPNDSVSYTAHTHTHTHTHTHMVIYWDHLIPQYFYGDLYMYGSVHVQLVCFVHTKCVKVVTCTCTCNYVSVAFVAVVNTAISTDLQSAYAIGFSD